MLLWKPINMQCFSLGMATASIIFHGPQKLHCILLGVNICQGSMQRRRSFQKGLPEWQKLGLQDYCLNKEDFEYIQSVTHFKGSYPWNADLYKSVPTTVKSTFTRWNLSPAVPRLIRNETSFSSSKAVQS